MERSRMGKVANRARRKHAATQQVDDKLSDDAR